MAYEMHEWVCNEPITAEKLNHMEVGIVEAQNDESSGGGALVVKVSETQDVENYILYDKTWQEVYDAAMSGRIVMLQEEASILGGSGTAFSYLVQIVDNGGGVSFGTDENNVTLTAPTTDDYLRKRNAPTQ